MNRLFFTFNNDDEYFAKTTEIDDTTKAIITAIYPYIKANSSFVFNSISIGNQAPNDAAFIDLLKTLAIFLTGSLGGVLAGNGLKSKPKPQDTPTNTRDS